MPGGASYKMNGDTLRVGRLTVILELIPLRGQQI